jgi:hypothetical protein
MEHLFAPCTRLYDILESPLRVEQFRGRHLLVGLQELNLNVSTEELLSAERAFTYADLYALLGPINTVTRLTPHIAVVRNHVEPVVAWSQIDESSCCFSFSADG